MRSDITVTHRIVGFFDFLHTNKALRMEERVCDFDLDMPVEVCLGMPSFCRMHANKLFFFYLLGIYQQRAVIYRTQ